MSLGQFINPIQLGILREFARKGEEKQFFIDKLSEIQDIIDTMPKTGETDGQGMDAIVQLHYFYGSSHFFITEKDMEEEQEQAFGYACINGDWEMAELGYISIVEILEVGAELDLYWDKKPLRDAIREKRGR